MDKKAIREYFETNCTEKPAHPNYTFVFKILTELCGSLPHHSTTKAWWTRICDKAWDEMSPKENKNG